MKMIKRAWITLNRNCNLRCKWCYAQSTGYRLSDNMNLDLALKLLELVYSIGAKDVLFIGGEPTCDDELNKIVNYANELTLNTTLITNGIALDNKAYLDKLIYSGLSNIDVSLKGYSQTDFLNSTSVDAYDKVMNAIKNVAQTKIPFIVSMVITCDNVDNFLEGIRKAVECGAENFRFSFCNDFSALDRNEINNNYDIEQNVFHVIKGFEKNYEELCRITHDNFLLHQTFPLCAWDFEFVNRLRNDLHITSSCQLFEQNSIIFDTNANVIPCNSMHQAPIGKYGEDFSSPSELLEYWNSERIISYYQMLALTPPNSYECTNCDHWEVCGGGCISNWYNYSYEDLMNNKLKSLSHADNSNRSVNIGT